MYFQKFIAPLKKEVSTSKVTFTSFLKPIRTKNNWKSLWGKTQLIMKQSEKRQIFTGKSP